MLLIHRKHNSNSAILFYQQGIITLEIKCEIEYEHL
jgi:hypothetical protein